VQLGDPTVPRRHATALVAELLPKPIGLREVGREALAVGPFPLRFGGPLAGPAALRRCLRLRLGGLGRGCLSPLRLLMVVVVLGMVEGERDLREVRLSRHLGTS
jgi:hypothetical protein